LKVFALLQVLGVEGVFELDDETCALRNGVRRRDWRRRMIDRLRLCPSRFAVVVRTGFQHWIVSGASPRLLRQGADRQGQAQSQAANAGYPLSMHGDCLVKVVR